MPRQPTEKNTLLQTSVSAVWLPEHEQYSPNYDGYLVIGAGLPRTGTMSLQAALQKLLNGPCYHMLHVLRGTKEDINHWENVFNGNISDDDWINFLVGRGFRSGVDYPIALYFETLMRVFPDAKVVLTTRDPEKWYNSVKETIFRTREFLSGPIGIFLKMVGMFNIFNTMDNLTNAINKRSLFDAIACGKTESVTFYNNWAMHVKMTVPANRLLVFEPKEGWEPLCIFLNLPIPEDQFPHVNDATTISWNIKKLKLVAYTTLYGVPILLGTVVAFILFSAFELQGT